MRLAVILTTITLLTLAGCGQQHAPETGPADIPAHADMEMPDDPTHQNADEARHDMGLNTEITVTDEIRSAWNGVILEVTDGEGVATRHELVKGEATPLGDTGLTATAIEFLPAFEMGDTGITSRSNEVSNPAVHISIIEDGKPDYLGWLFADLPTIHPFPHEDYTVVLVAGVPSK